MDYTTLSAEQLKEQYDAFSIRLSLASEGNDTEAIERFTAELKKISQQQHLPTP